MTNIILPGTVSAAAKARNDLRVEVNAELAKQNASPLPVGDDFVDVNKPLRIEIEILLGRVKGNPNKLKAVETYLDTTYPGNKMLKTLILSDLESYHAWEKKGQRA